MRLSLLLLLLVLAVVRSVQRRGSLCPGIDPTSSAHLEPATIVADTTVSDRPLSTVRGTDAVTISA